MVNRYLETQKGRQAVLAGQVTQYALHQSTFVFSHIHQSPHYFAFHLNHETLHNVMHYLFSQVSLLLR